MGFNELLDQNCSFHNQKSSDSYLGKYKVPPLFRIPSLHIALTSTSQHMLPGTKCHGSFVAGDSDTAFVPHRRMPSQVQAVDPALQIKAGYMYACKTR